MKNVIKGTLTGNSGGYAFLTPENKNVGEDDYFIPHGELRGAMHGDTVLCETEKKEVNKNFSTTARVLKVLERGIDRVVGTYFSGGKGGFVSPDDDKFFTDVFVPFGKGLRAKSGDKVAVKILSYPHRRAPEGIIIKVFGRQFDKNAELAALLYGYKLPEKFPKAVIEESESLPRVRAEDYTGRLDLREKNIFTIDGEDAKDFDDAVSVEKTADNKYVLGVHIADVSHYVKFGGEIDKEAFSRGTSVYFPEKVIPMLPERLSNDLCSLVEGEERLTVSCIMTVNADGKVENYEIHPSVIKSVKRAVYSEVEKILNGDDTPEGYEKIRDDIFLMQELAGILTAKNRADGAIDLDVKESVITVDKKGKINVSAHTDEKARRIIEQFMIAANCTVAEYLFFSETPCVYRIHEKPTDEKTEKFYGFLAAIGVNAKRNKTVYSKDFADILEKTLPTPAYTVINRVMLRSMMKAKYSAEDVGHFGLSKTHYCHFTSPIRRYPDLTVHRILKDFIAGNTDLESEYGDFAVKVADKSSEAERKAQDAERAADDFYKLLYIDGYIGEEFSAVISGVTDFGLFAEIDNGVEGFIDVQTLKGKRLKADKKSYSLTDGKKTYKLGQSVKIKVVGVNFSRKRAEFILSE